MIRVKDVYDAIDRSPDEVWGTVSVKDGIMVINLWGQGRGEDFSFPEGRGAVWPDEYLFHTHPRGYTCLPSATDLANTHVPHDFMWVFGEDGAAFFSPASGILALYMPDDVLAKRLRIIADGQEREIGDG